MALLLFLILVNIKLLDCHILMHQKNIKRDISNKFAGTEAYISLNSVRSKQIFALGNVRSPGTYALNAFGTALNALISSGGVKIIVL